MTDRQPSTHLASLAAPDSMEAEAYRALRTNLEVAAGPDVTVMVMTSPSPGAGKAEAICNLAVSAAQAGRSVVLVDADWRRPSPLPLEGGDSGGLAEALQSDAAADTLLETTPVEGLRLLPRGVTPARPADLLASPRMQSTLASLRSHAQWVLVHVPPVLAASDAATVARLADGVILVVGSGHTRRDDIARSRESLQRVQAPILGLVMSGVSPKDAGFEHFTAPGETPDGGQGHEETGHR